MKEDAIRAKLDEVVRGSKGAAKQLAEDAGICQSTLSRFRTGTYAGRSDLIAEKLAVVLNSREAAEALSDGRLKVSWLVSTRAGVRLIKRRDTLEALKIDHPDAVVIRIWRGAMPHEIFFETNLSR